MKNFHEFDPYDSMIKMNNNIQTLIVAHNTSQGQIDLLQRQLELQQTQLIDLRRDLLNQQLSKSI
jgi:hypothetical protein